MTAHDLARRAVACRHWRWMPGMLPLVVDEDGDYVACDRVWRTQGGHTVAPAEALPDLTDPATVGCLLALVREAWDDPLICVAVDNTGAGWWVDGWAAARQQVPCDLHPTEAAALVAALEAAP